MKTQIFWDVLDKKQKLLLPKLAFLKDKNFYLAGGTALSLQIRHRTSLDFDFYKEKNFNNDNLLMEFHKASLKGALIQKSEGTIELQIAGKNISCFYYPYKLVKPLTTTEYLFLASAPDIAAMKMIALIQRGLRRDFIDLYFLTREYGLREIFRWTEKKYPLFQPYIGLQALTYFTDADKSGPDRAIRSLEPVVWDEIKKFFVHETKRLKNTLKEREP
jgi:predicted nucleotidyltransferase component of viral defense system